MRTLKSVSSTLILNEGNNLSEFPIKVTGDHRGTPGVLVIDTNAFGDQLSATFFSPEEKNAQSIVRLVTIAEGVRSQDSLLGLVAQAGFVAVNQ